MSSSEDSDASSDFEDIENSSDEEDVCKEYISIFISYSYSQVPNILVPNEQWVQFIEFCSIKSKSKDSVSTGTGVQKLCQATNVDFGEKDKAPTGWILNNNNQEEYLIVSFPTPVFINEIHIYESLNPGSIVKLEMLESQQSKNSKKIEQTISVHR